jgi:hypothetical protein
MVTTSSHSNTYVLQPTAIFVTRTVIRDEQQLCPEYRLTDGLSTRTYKTETERYVKH